MPLPRSGTVAALAAPIIRMHLRSDVPVSFGFWDGSRVGPDNAAVAVEIRSIQALRHIAWAPTELGVARAFLLGEVELVGGDLMALKLLRGASSGRISRSPSALLAYLRLALRLRLPGPRPRVPVEEFAPRRFRHTRKRDRAVIEYHYDISNDVFEKILGPTMTYTCARFSDSTWSLERAQEAKYEGICDKLALTPGMRVLDIGCGWGGFAIYAAKNYQVGVVGVTLSQAQADYARKRIAEEGLTDSIEILLQDYRDIDESLPFDAVASIGMMENVGRRNLARYFDKVSRLMSGEARFINQAIAARGRSRTGRYSFAQRYVFPDGELCDISQVISCLQDAGLELESVESLRSSYALTLARWVNNLAENYESIEAEIGRVRARVFRLFMTASINKFETGRLSVFQTVASQASDAKHRS